MLTKRIIAAALLFIAGPAFAGLMPLIGGGGGGGAVGATTYYVDNAAGSDSNNGKSPAAAWATITKVNAGTYNPGDSVLFKGGQTFTVASAVSCGVGTGVVSTTALCLTATNSLGTAASPVTFGSFATGTATIQALTTNAALMAYNVGNIKLTNLTFTGNGLTTPMATNAIGGVQFVNSLAGNVKLDGVTVNQVTINGFSRSGLAFISTVGSSGYKNVAITNVTAFNNTSSTDGNNNSGDAGIYFFANANYGGGRTNPAFQTVLIDHCYVHDNPGNHGGTITNWTGSGIFVNNTSGATVQYNVIANNSTNGIGAVGLFGFDSSGSIFQYNEIYGTSTTSTADGDGIDIDANSANAIVQYNYTHNNSGAGVLVYIYSDNSGVSPITTTDNVQVRYNVSQNDASLSNYGSISLGNGGSLAGPTPATLSNIYVYNNALYQTNATQVIRISSAASSGTNPITATVANNIMYVSGTAKSVGNAQHQTAATMTFKTNDYFNTGAFSADLNGTTYATFAAWQSAQDTSGVSTNPLLTTPGGGTTTNTTPGVPSAQASAYLLQSSSTMKGLGANLAVLYSINVGANDFFGRTLSTTAFNVGADATPVSGCTAAQVIITSGTSTTVPCWWNTSSKAEALGGGGGGNGNTSNVGTGGEGGHYAKSTSLSLTPGATVNLQIGAGGAGNGTGPGGAGTATWFGGTSLATSLVGAQGGAGSTGTATNAATSTVNDVGNVVVRAGGAGPGFSVNNFGGSAGGGAAGPGGVGGNGAAAVAGLGGGGGGGAGNTSGAGSIGGAASGSDGGRGGAAGDGTAGGAGGVNTGTVAPVAGSHGSGGGGGYGAGGGAAGGAGSESTWGGTVGPGGGGGAGGGTNTAPSGNGGAGGLYGGGGGGAGWRPGTAVGGNGAGGILVLTP